MTERPGGSDLSHTETVATMLPQPEGIYDASLNGFKCAALQMCACADAPAGFSSALDGAVSLALARLIEGFVVYRDTIGPVAYFANIAIHINLAKDYLYVTSVRAIYEYSDPSPADLTAQRPPISSS